MSALEYRNKMLAELRRSRSNFATLVEEYIDESEHQDGEGYWQQFETVGEMLEDFDLYMEYQS